MKTFYTHPDNPQTRHIDEVANDLKNGKIAIIPSNIGYCFAVGLNTKSAFEKLSQYYNEFAVLSCQNLSQISQFATIDNAHFRQIKSLENSSVIFQLTATKETPKFLQQNKQVNIAFSNHTIINLLIDKLAEPIILFPLKEPLLVYEIEDGLGHLADYFVNIGDIEYYNYSIVELSNDTANIIKQGDDNLSVFLS